MPPTHEASPDLLPLEEALGLLPESEAVHTWKNDGLTLRPRFMAKDAVVALMEQFGVRRANAGAERLSHGLRIDTPDAIVFVQTREA